MHKNQITDEAFPRTPIRNTSLDYQKSWFPVFLLRTIDWPICISVKWLSDGRWDLNLSSVIIGQTGGNRQNAVHCPYHWRSTFNLSRLQIIVNMIQLHFFLETKLQQYSNFTKVIFVNIFFLKKGQYLEIYLSSEKRFIIVMDNNGIFTSKTRYLFSGFVHSNIRKVLELCFQTSQRNLILSFCMHLVYLYCIYMHYFLQKHWWCECIVNVCTEYILKLLKLWN